MQRSDSESWWLGIAVAVAGGRGGSSGYSGRHADSVADLEGVPGVFAVEAGVALVIGQLAVGEGPGPLLQAARSLVPHHVVPRVHAATVVS